LLWNWLDAVQSLDVVPDTLLTMVKIRRDQNNPKIDKALTTRIYLDNLMRMAEWLRYTPRENFQQAYGTELGFTP
jgi:hypothetical protein